MGFGGIKATGAFAGLLERFFVKKKNKKPYLIYFVHACTHLDNSDGKVETIRWSDMSFRWLGRYGDTCKL